MSGFQYNEGVLYGDRGRVFGKLIAGVVGGIVAAAFGVPWMGILLSNFDVAVERSLSIWVTLFIATSVVAAVTAGRPAKAWRRVLIGAAVCSLGLSFTHLLSAANDTGSSGTVGVVSFFFGVVLLLIGMLVGRDTKDYVPKRDGAEDS